MTQPIRNPLLDLLCQPRRLNAVTATEPVTLTTYYAPRRRTAIAPPVSLPVECEPGTDYEDDADPEAASRWDEDDERRSDERAYSITGEAHDDECDDPGLDMGDGDCVIPHWPAGGTAVRPSPPEVEGLTPIDPAAPAAPAAPATVPEPAEPLVRPKRQPLVVIRRSLKKKGGR